MKKFYAIMAGLLMLAACSNDDFKDSVNGMEGVKSFTTFTVTIGDMADTRAHIIDPATGGKKYVDWNDGDEIIVFSKEQSAFKKYTLTETTDGVGQFVGEKVTGTNFVALYPASGWTLDENNPNLLHYDRSSALAKRYDDFMFNAPMIATSSDNSFSFKQTTGMIHVSIGGICKLNNVMLKSNNGEVLDSKGTLDLSEENPALKVDGQGSLSLYSYEGNMDTDPSTLADVYFIIPPMTFEKGFTLTIDGNDEDGNHINLQKTSANALTIERGTVNHFSLINVNAELAELEADRIEKETRQKEILLELFNATDGEHWSHNDNWKSDAPLKDWYGITVDGSGSVSVNLYQNNLSGNIPESIGNLTNLRSLDLGYNQLSGSIPESISNLTSLVNLRLYNNQLTGSIPESISNLTNLEILYLYNNQLTGNIPESIGNLTSLRILDLYGNQLTGTIPESIGNLTNLMGLDLYGNQLTGTIPESISNLTSLVDLRLHNNQLTGTIPESISNLTNLGGLSLSANQLTGSIPESISNLTSLVDLRLHNNQLTGSIPESISNLTNLRSLHLSGNQLTGSIPESIGNLTNLTSLSLDNNLLTGSIPESIGYLTNLKYLDLYSNQLTGSIPESIGYLTSLVDLRLHNNQLTGSIPESISNLTNLEYLDLDYNQLTGTIPESISNLTNLRSLHLSGNQLTGNIPVSVKNNSQMYYFDVSGNLMNGVVPMEIQESAWWNNENTYVYYGYQKEDNRLLLGFEAERDALNTLYDETGGANWTNRSGWDDNYRNSRRLLKYRYGITTDENGHITKIELPNNNMTGEIPAVFDKFPELRQVNLNNNNLESVSNKRIWNNPDKWAYITQPGFLKTLLNLEHLEIFKFAGNKMNGCISQKLSDLIYYKNKKIYGLSVSIGIYFTPQQNGYDFFAQEQKTTYKGGGNMVEDYKQVSPYTVPNAYAALNYIDQDLDDAILLDENNFVIWKD